MNIVQKIILISLCSVFLCACQTDKQIEGSSYALAVDAGSRLQPKKVVPVPMPGQLMPINNREPKQLVGENAIDEANKKSLKQPKSGGYINSIMTFDYMQGALYQVYAAPLNVTDIQFQNGEHIVAVGAGDTTRWLVSKTYSGIGATRQEHLLVKPTDEGLVNNLVVTTDLRTYHMMLRSTPKTYMASVTWRYPNSDNLITNFEDVPGDSDTEIGSEIDVNQMTFNYDIKLVKGPKPDWFPKIVFNDTNKTYIKFTSNAQEAPSLLIGNTKSNQITNFRVQGNYYVIDKVVEQALLRGGPGNQSVVQISMKKK